MLRDGHFDADAKKRKTVHSRCYESHAMNAHLHLSARFSGLYFGCCVYMCMLFVCMYHVGAGRGCRLDRSCKSCARAASFVVVLVVNVVVFIDTRIKRRCGSRLNVSSSCPHSFMFPRAVESSPLQFLALA